MNCKHCDVQIKQSIHFQNGWAHVDKYGALYLYCKFPYGSYGEQLHAEPKEANEE